MKKQTATKLALLAVTAMLAGFNAKATIAINYEVGSTSINLGQTWLGYDTIALAGKIGSINLTEGSPVQAVLNNVKWTTSAFAQDDTTGNTLTRSIQINLLTPQNITQSASLDVNWGFFSQSQTLTIASSSPVFFSWTDAGMDYTLQIIANALTLNDPNSLDCDEQEAGKIKGVFTLTSKSAIPTTGAVPEPSTVVAGALLLLPFGVSTLRIMRRKKTV